MAKRKRIEETLEHQIEMWRASRNSPADPGLRDIYHAVPKLPIRLICPRLDKEINHGNLLRIAEAFRLELVVFAPDAIEKSGLGMGAFLASCAVMLALGVLASWLFSKVEDRYASERDAIDAG